MIYVVDPTLINLLKMHNQSKKKLRFYIYYKYHIILIYDIHFMIIVLYYHAKISSDFGVDKI